MTGRCACTFLFPPVTLAK
uniref:Uncharacterized protein n=1 Tax=Anguilla anguilla TaxID=7936 RepID=A0A0E9QUJ5_ANGAN